MTKTIVILCGPRPDYGFCPVPPMTDSAPERNIFRLSEFNYEPDLDIHVISACNSSQFAELIHRVDFGHYHQITFPSWSLGLNVTYPFQNRVMGFFYHRVLHSNDLFSWIYLIFACKMIKKIRPDIIIINSLPQYIQIVRDRFSKTLLGLFVRGEIGASREYLHLVDLIITNSDGIARYVKDLLNGACVPVKVIPNTLDLLYCKKKKSFRDAERKKVVYVGRIVKVKGILELLRAFRFVQQKFPAATLEIVGGNYGRSQLSEYEKELLRFATVNKLNVKFVGQVPNNMTPDIFLDADIAVFPSLWLESFGMVALEAMRCSLPIIASRRPGFEELIVDGETGFLVGDPADSKVLADAMIRLISCPKKAKKMGKMGYIRSLEFTPDKINNQFKQIVLEIINKNGINEY